MSVEADIDYKMLHVEKKCAMSNVVVNPRSRRQMGPEVDDVYQVIMPDYFYENMRREEADRLLKQDGDFLVRSSAAKPGEYILQVKWSLASYHFVIPRNEVNEHQAQRSAVRSTLCASMDHRGDTWMTARVLRCCRMMVCRVCIVQFD